MINKAVATFAIKVGSSVMKLITAQIIKYLSSEEFSNSIKKLIKNMVEQLVKLVISEKKATNNWNRSIKGKDNYIFYYEDIF